MACRIHILAVESCVQNWESSSRGLDRRLRVRKQSGAAGNSIAGRWKGEQDRRRVWLPEIKIWNEKYERQRRKGKKGNGVRWSRRRNKDNYRNYGGTGRRATYSIYEQWKVRRAVCLFGTRIYELRRILGVPRTFVFYNCLPG